MAEKDTKGKEPDWNIGDLTKGAEKPGTPPLLRPKFITDPSTIPSLASIEKMLPAYRRAYLNTIIPPEYFALLPKTEPDIQGDPVFQSCCSGITFLVANICREGLGEYPDKLKEVEQSERIWMQAFSARALAMKARDG